MRDTKTRLTDLIAGYCLTYHELYGLTIPAIVTDATHPAISLSTLIKINLANYCDAGTDETLISFAHTLFQIELFMVLHFVLNDEDAISKNANPALLAEVRAALAKTLVFNSKMPIIITCLLAMLCDTIFSVIENALGLPESPCLPFLKKLEARDPEAGRILRAGLEQTALSAATPDDDPIFAQSRGVLSTQLRGYFQKELDPFRDFIYQHGQELASQPEFKRFFSLIPAPQQATKTRFFCAAKPRAAAQEKEILKILAQKKGSLAYIALRLSELLKASNKAATTAQSTQGLKNYFEVFAHLLQEAQECHAQITQNPRQEELATVLLILVMVVAVTQFNIFLKSMTAEESAELADLHIPELNKRARDFMAIFLTKINPQHVELRNHFESMLVRGCELGKSFISTTSVLAALVTPGQFSSARAAELLIEDLTQTDQRDNFFNAFQIICDSLTIKTDETAFDRAFTLHLEKLSEMADMTQQEIFKSEEIRAEKLAAKEAARQADLAAREDQERQRKFEARQKARALAEAQGGVGAGPAPLEELAAPSLSEIELFVQRTNPQPFEKSKLDAVNKLLGRKNLDLQEQAELHILRAKLFFESVRSSCPAKMPEPIRAQIEDLDRLAHECRKKNLDAYPDLLDTQRAQLQNKFKSSPKAAERVAPSVASKAKNYKDQIPHEVRVILQALQTTSPRPGQFKPQALIFGGYPRDILLKKKSKDIDIMCLVDINSLTKEEQEKYLAALEQSILRLKYTVKVVKSKKDELYHFNIGGKNFDVKFSNKKNMAAHFKACDFMCNTACLNLNGDIYGFFPQTILDIEQTICRPADPETFFDDPLRLLRTVHMVINKGYSLEKEFKQKFDEFLAKFKALDEENLTRFLQGEIDIDKNPLNPKKLDSKNHFVARLKALLFSVINEDNLKDPSMVTKQKIIADKLGASVLKLVAEKRKAACAADSLRYGMLAYSEVFLECVGHQSVAQDGDVALRSREHSLFQEAVRARVAADVAAAAAGPSARL